MRRLGSVLAWSIVVACGSEPAPPPPTPSATPAPASAPASPIATVATTPATPTSAAPAAPTPREDPPWEVVPQRVHRELYGATTVGDRTLVIGYDALAIHDRDGTARAVYPIGSVSESDGADAAFLALGDDAVIAMRRDRRAESENAWEAWLWRYGSEAPQSISSGECMACIRVRGARFATVTSRDGATIVADGTRGRAVTVPGLVPPLLFDVSNDGSHAAIADAEGRIARIDLDGSRLLGTTAPDPMRRWTEIAASRDRVALVDRSGAVVVHDGTRATVLVPGDAQQAEDAEDQEEQDDSYVAPALVTAVERTLAFTNDGAHLYVRDATSALAYDVARGTELDDDEDTLDDAAFDALYDVDRPLPDQGSAPTGLAPRSVWGVEWAPDSRAVLVRRRRDVLLYGASGVRDVPCADGISPVTSWIGDRIVQPGPTTCNVRTGEGDRRRAWRDEGGDYQRCPAIVTEAEDDEGEIVDVPPAVEMCGGDRVELVNATGVDADSGAIVDDVLIAAEVPTGTRVWAIESGEPIVTIAGGGRVLGASRDGAVLYVVRRRDRHLALIARRGARTLLDAGEVVEGDASRPFERDGRAVLVTTSGVRVVAIPSAETIVEIAQPGVRRAWIAGERIVIRTADRIAVHRLDGTRESERADDGRGGPTADGTAIARCEGEVREVRDAITGATIATSRAGCGGTLSPDGRFVAWSGGGDVIVRRIADGEVIALGHASGSQDEVSWVASDGGTAWQSAPGAVCVRARGPLLSATLACGDAVRPFLRDDLLRAFFEGAPVPRPPAAGG